MEHTTATVSRLKLNKGLYLLSIGVCLALQYAWLWCLYAFVRSDYIGWSVEQYVLVLLLVAVFGLPIYGLLGAVCLAVHGSFNRRLLRAMLVAGVLGVAVAETWVGAQDALLLFSPPNASVEDAGSRWYPFSAKRIVFDASRGWRVISH